MERFYNKNTLCYKNIKKSGAIFGFCHKRMQPTALGVKKQIKITKDIDNSSVSFERWSLFLHNFFQLLQ
jgi:hypothetical protein